jgi:hypothetical protein
LFENSIFLIKKSKKYAKKQQKMEQKHPFFDDFRVKNGAF